MTSFILGRGRLCPWVRAKQVLEVKKDDQGKEEKKNELAEECSIEEVKKAENKQDLRK